MTLSRGARLLALAGPLIVAPIAASAQGESPSGGLGRLAGQITAGTLTIPVGFLAGGLLSRQLALSFGASADAASATARVGAGVGAALFSSAAVAAVGSRGPATGSYLASLGGVAAGGLASYALVRMNRRGDNAAFRCGALCRVSVVALALLPATGGTIAFNASRQRE